MYGIIPRYNEPRYNEFFGLTNIIRKPKRKIYLDITNYNVNTRQKTLLNKMLKNGLNKMPKAFLARAAGVNVLGGSGGMLPRKVFKINASRMAKNTSQLI